jgi:hypothetical protein
MLLPVFLQLRIADVGHQFFFVFKMKAGVRYQLA